MEARLDYRSVAPDAYEAMLALERFVRHGTGLDAGLIALVKVRASQVNGCAFCIDLHTREARAGGESEQRLYALSAWAHAPFFTDRERAALAWTEALTTIADGPVSDDLYSRASRQFSGTELVNLTVVCNAINSWNRLAVAFHAQPPLATRAKVMS